MLLKERMESFEQDSEVPTQVAEAAVIHEEDEDAEGSADGRNRGEKVYVGNIPFGTSWQDLKDHMRRAGNVQYVRLFLDQYGQSKGCALVEYSTHDEAMYAIKTLHNTPLGSRVIFVREDREGDGERRSEDGDDAEGSSEFPSQAPASFGFGGPFVRPPPRGAYRGAPAFRGAVRGGLPPVGMYRGMMRGGAFAARGRGAFHPNNAFRGNVRGRGRGRGAPRGPPRATPGTYVYFGNLPFSSRWRDLKELVINHGMQPVRADVVMSSPGRSKGYGFVVFQTEEEAEKCVGLLNSVELEGRAITVHINRPFGERESSSGPSDEHDGQEMEIHSPSQ